MKRSIISVYLLSVLSAALVFAGGGQQGGSGSGGSGGVNSDGSLKYKGTITMYAQAYSPDAPTATNPNPPTKFREVAAKWQALNPGITIEFLTQLEQGQDYLTWLRTKLAGAQAPDIFWAQCTDLNAGTIPAGSFYQLNEYLDRPNKYIPGYTKWLSTFQPGLVQQTSGSKGEINNINADYVGTLVVYNVALFKKAGINFEIKTWSDYTRACQMLKAAGITPWAFCFGNAADRASYMTWFGRLFHTNMYYNDFAKLAVISGSDAIAINSPLEVAIGVKNGYFSPDDPRYMGFWPLLKDHIQNYMPRDAISPASTAQAILSMFINQEIAMHWDGSWVGNDLKAANVTWEYGTFPWPRPEKAATPLAPDLDSSPAAGGPFAAFQYAVSTPRSNSGMNDDKLAAVLDWLQFITTPENNADIVNDLGSFIPTIIGAKPKAENAALVSLLEAEPLNIEVIWALGNDVQDTYYREFQSYAQGNQTLEQAAAKVKVVVERSADDIIAKSGVDVKPYLKK
jgi:raffinose/stachyose/melibiose transport system substrate-binding protein